MHDHFLGHDRRLILKSTQRGADTRSNVIPFVATGKRLRHMAITPNGIPAVPGSKRSCQETDLTQRTECNEMLCNGNTSRTYSNTGVTR